MVQTPKWPEDKWKERTIKTEKVSESRPYSREVGTESPWASAGGYEEGEEPLWSCLIPVFIGPATERSLCYTQAENHHMGRERLCTQQTGTVNEKYYERLSCNHSLHISTSLHPPLCLLLLLEKLFKETFHIQTSSLKFLVWFKFGKVYKIGAFPATVRQVSVLKKVYFLQVSSTLHYRWAFSKAYHCFWNCQLVFSTSRVATGFACCIKNQLVEIWNLRYMFVLSKGHHGNASFQINHLQHHTMITYEQT